MRLQELILCTKIFAIRSQSAKNAKMITLETLVPYATSLMKGQKLNVYLLNCIRVAKLELHVFLEFHIIIPQGRNSWDTGMCECWCTQVRFAWAPRTAASEVDKSLPNPVLSLSYLHTHTLQRRLSIIYTPNFVYILHLSTHTMLHICSVLHMLFVCFNHTAHTPSLHVHASYLHTLVICCVLHNKKQKELLGASILQAFHMHTVKLCYARQMLFSIVTIEVALVTLKRKLS